MMRKILIAAAVAVCCVPGARAQYYEQGQAPASIRWNQIKTPGGNIIFPRYYQSNAVRYMHYLDTLRPVISHGFRHGTMRMPVVLSTENFLSNGLVMFAPKRMELMAPPDVAPYAEPWLKQLATHEYRHNVQFNNLNRGTIKALSYVIGQQGSVLGMGLMPMWLIEGDATMAETELSPFGRGLQPSFTIDYRAQLAEGKRFGYGKLVCGSYRDFVPDHYHLGYQAATWSYTRYGHNIWDRVAKYSSDYPFFLFTTYFALRRYYDTHQSKLVGAAFDDLQSYWASLPPRENSADIIPTPVKSYTTYASPLPVADSTIVALKSDMDNPSRFVEVNTTTGRERMLFHTGRISTRPRLNDGRVYWTEYRQSTVWEQKVNSTLFSYDLATGKRHKYRHRQQVLYPTPVYDGEMVLVKYNYEGTYSICINDWVLLTLPPATSVHGLAYDYVTTALYFIGLDDDGMWIGRVEEEGGYSVVKRPSYVSIYDLAAADGKLYFNSIASGYDEAHVLDLRDGTERRLTTSKYGSVSPTPFADGESVAVTTFTPQGYMLARQSLDKAPLEEVPRMRLPQNVVNPPRKRWDVMKIDTIRVADTTSREIKKYRKGLHLFNIHSWAPVAMDPEEIISADENRVNINLGATVIWQSLLNTSIGSARYAWTKEGSMGNIAWNYLGWTPKFDLEATYGGGKQGYAYYWKPGTPLPAPPESRKNYFSVLGRVYFPLVLADGYHYRYLQPTLQIEHFNTLFYDYGSASYQNGGLQKLTAALYFGDQTRLAPRDFLPRWAYSLRATVGANPFRDDFGTTYSLAGRVYTPGILPHNSFTAAAAVQYIHNVKDYNFRSKELYPRGAEYNITPTRYVALSANYALPVACPDLNVWSVVYLKRIRLAAGFDWARMLPVHSTRWQNVHSWGATLDLDVNIFLAVAPATNTISVSLFRPSDTKRWTASFNVSIPL